MERVSAQRADSSLARRIADFFFGYDFFISYAHRDGPGYPRALAAALEARGYRTFLDEREYSAGEDLRIGTRRMVAKSRYLVLVARDILVEREERDSLSWVRQEVEVCVHARRAPVVIDVNGAFARASPGNRLRRLLADRIFIQETTADADGTPSDAVVQKLADGFRATRQETLRLRWISSAALALLVLASAAVWQGWLAERRRVEAERQRDEAYARLLTIEGRRIANDAPDTSLLLAAAAVRIRPSAASLGLLRSLLVSDPRHERFLQAGVKPWHRAAFAPDGSALLAQADDGSVARVQIEQTRLVSHPLEHGGEALSSIAFSPDGGRAAGGTQDGRRILIWDLRTGRVERMLEADHRGPVESLVFSPDGTLLVSGGAFTSTFLWDMRSGARRAQLDQHKSGVKAVAFAPDGGRVATAAEGGRIVIWSLDTVVPTHKVLDQQVPPFVFALAFSRDGERLAAGGQGDAVVVWNLDDPDSDPVRLSGQHSADVVQLRFAVDGAALAVLARDGRVSFYKPTGGQYGTFAPFDAGAGRFGDMVYHNGGKTMLTIGPGSHVRRWSLDVPLEPGASVMPGHEKGTLDVAFGADGTLLSAGCPGPREALMDMGCASAGELRRWDASTSAALGPASAIEGRKIIRIVSRPSDGMLLLALSDGHLAVWDPVRNRIVGDHRRPGAPANQNQGPGSASQPASTSSATAVDGVHSASLSGQSNAAPVARPAPSCELHSTTPDAIAMLPRGDAVYYAGGSRGCVFRWREKDGWTSAPLLEHGASVTAIAVSADGNRLAVGGRDGSLQAWVLAPVLKRLWRSSIAPGARPTALAFSPVDDLLAVGLAVHEAQPRKGFMQGSRMVGSALLWSVAANRPLATIGTGGTVRTVEFSPDGQLAVVGGCRQNQDQCSRGELLLWHVASSQQLGPSLAVHRGEVRRIAFRHDGSMFATVSEANEMNNDPRIALWDVRPEAWIARACEVAGRQLLAQEMDRYLGGIYPDPCASRPGRTPP